MNERLTIMGVGGFFVAGVVAAFGVDAVTSYESAIATAERETRSAAAQASEQTRHLFDAANGVFRAAMLLNTEWRQDPAHNSATGYRLVKAFELGSEFLIRVAWTDADGNIVVSSEGAQPTKLNIANRPFFYSQMDRVTTDMHVSAPSQPRSDEFQGVGSHGGWISVISRRIESSDDAFKGIVLGAVSPSHLSRVLERQYASSNVSVSILLADGRVFARHPSFERFVGGTWEKTALFRDLLPIAAEGTFHDRSPQTGERLIHSYERVEGYPLVVSISMPRSIALMPWYDRIRITGIFTLLAVLGGIVATGFIWRQAAVVRRQERIAQEARRAAEQSAADLERSNRELDDFAYIASHDLKAPLRGIYNYSAFLLEDYADEIDDDGKSKLKSLGRLAKRMEDIINDLLTFSRVGRTELSFADVDLNAVVADVVEANRVFLDEAGATVEIARPLPRLHCDQVRVRAIFHNLIVNGVKYNDNAEKRIAIGWHGPQAGSAPQELVFSVADNGIGIPEKHREKVFGIFKRLHGADSKYGAGTGAGLAIVKKTIERHGGRIWLESEVGQGTTFYFTLGDAQPVPLPERPAATAAPELAAAA
jgi:signal transduction histidine kinase